MTDSIPLVIDANGVEIEIDSVVNTPNAAKEILPGRVVKITDLDMDSDDEGRSYAIYPKVMVQWPESNPGELEDILTYTEARYSDEDPEPWCTEDLEVIKPDSKEIS